MPGVNTGQAGDLRDSWTWHPAHPLPGAVFRVHATHRTVGSSARATMRPGREIMTAVRSDRATVISPGPPPHPGHSPCRHCSRPLVYHHEVDRPQTSVLCPGLAPMGGFGVAAGLGGIRIDLGQPRLGCVVRGSGGICVLYSDPDLSQARLKSGRDRSHNDRKPVATAPDRLPSP